MIRKPFPFLLALLMSMVANVTLAHDAEIDGIYYNFSEDNATVTYKDENYFNSYSGSVTIPEFVTYNGKTYRVTSIGNSAFRNSSALNSVTLPGSITDIDIWAFYGCTSLTSIAIPEGVTTICSSTFRNCSSLTSITIPNGVTSIDFQAFLNCSALTSITIPEGVTSISGAAFLGCSGLTSIEIPESVTEIGYYAFDTGSSAVTSIRVGMKTPISISEDTFSSSYESATLYVPFGSKAAYETAYPWSRFGNITEYYHFIDLENQNIRGGNSTTVDINVYNYKSNLVGFQMDLKLPEGVSIDKAGSSLSSRITDEDQELTIGRLESGAYRITSTSLSLTPISGDDGTLLTLKLTAEDGCVGGQATISNIRFSTSESEKIIMSDVSFDISILYKLVYKVDGTDYNTFTFAYGTVITPETAPTKEGYTFSGMNEIPETMPARDVVIDGTFTINSYTLTYMVDGEVYKTSTVIYGTAITPESEPTKEGYTFSGWSEIPETMPAKDVVVTGSFSVNSYTLTYMVDGTEYKKLTVEYDTTIIPEAAPTKEGYSFSGWSEIPKNMPAKDVVVTGSFIINSYTLTYMVDGEVYKTSTVIYGTAITPESEPTKEGYTFSGWSAIPKTMPAKDVIVTGSFSINSYTLTYMVDDEEYKTLSIAYGTAITPETEPSKEGYTFSGWSEIPKTMPAKDMVVTGSFSINSYTLTYKVDGEEYKTTTIVYGTAITPESEPTKEGYTFSGWSEIPATMPAKDVVVTGSFSINSYTLTYMVDGEVYQSFIIKYRDAITPLEAPTKEGYTFSGWSGLPRSMPANDVTVYGKFTVNSYTVTFMDGDDVLYTEEVNYGEPIPIPEIKDKYGLVYKWLDVPETMPAHDVVIQVDETDMIDGPTPDPSLVERDSIYDLSGRKLPALQKGINIIRMSDGTSRKVLVK